ncbi:hypothetical protein [Schlesneria paludicola]|uniref:hypothetical protein n=1 Tax=Schlesneria paludicola TaxID=360056 RepID=UPI00029ABC65|nr:hypothetical protein [Schlesneria paludicola]
MRTSILGFLAIMSACSIVQAADDASIKKLVKANVEELNAALLKEDFAKAVSLTYPKLVKMAGGTKSLIESMESGTKSMNAMGISISSVVTNEPSGLLKSGNDLYTVVPFTLKMTVPNGTMRVKSFVIGVSSDQAKTWTFVNGDIEDEALKQVLPDLPKELKLPPKQKPQLEKN